MENVKLMNMCKIIDPTTKKVLVITNSMYEDYMDWCRDNYSNIANFNKAKKVSNGTETYFTKDQLDMISYYIILIFLQML